MGEGADGPRLRAVFALVPRGWHPAALDGCRGFRRRQMVGGGPLDDGFATFIMNTLQGDPGHPLSRVQKK